MVQREPLEDSDYQDLADGAGDASHVHRAEYPPDATTTASLDSLQSKESRRVMNIVDRLRRSGLSGELQLPQLVVAGDQSSGKSSVLEAITEIPFPRKENLCTRFATEIILRRANKVSITAKIIPDKKRPADDAALSSFSRSIIDLNELPGLFEEATNLMGLGDDGSGVSRAFSRDVLSVEIAGPGRPHLTLVDLPGLIHSQNKHQGREDVELIRDLVHDYIQQSRTIIMAVISAKNDYANQIILQRCREVDPKGSRTLGIITKPDFLTENSENEAAWLDLARNRDIFFELGWHMLKNRSDKEIESSFAQRNTSETAFFAKGKYRNLPSEMTGITSLRTRLSHLLYKHLKTELPALQKEVNDRYHQVCRDLDSFGEKRATTQEQRKFLMTASQKYQKIVNDAAKGHYEHSFFGVPKANAALDDTNNMRRLRAVVQFLNVQYSNLMRGYGQTSKITDQRDDEKTICGPELSIQDPEYASFVERQEKIDRDTAIQRVSNMLIRSRGRELPCTFNPLLISHLFWEQSSNWPRFADSHVERVAEVCSKFVHAAIEETVASDIASRLISLKVDQALNDRLSKAKKELGFLVQDLKRHPITYNPRYAEAVQERRHQVYNDRVSKLAKEAQAQSFDFSGANHEAKVDKPTLKRKRTLEDRGDGDMEKISAEQALDDSLAYYEV